MLGYTYTAYLFSLSKERVHRTTRGRNYVFISGGHNDL